MTEFPLREGLVQANIRKLESTGVFEEQGSQGWSLSKICIVNCSPGELQSLLAECICKTASKGWATILFPSVLIELDPS